ncbi:hypothetical protein PHISP_02151 [Aspergillus sp. HF37]|nr:hypothetical protein PHISP_02151 [Aspergillus sp. HF37]
MKEALIDNSLTVTIHDTQIPTPGPNQVLIRVVVSGSNPKDWKLPKIFGQTDSPKNHGDDIARYVEAFSASPKNHGDDIAGYVEAVGAGVAQFRKGDRVAAFHEMMTAHGSYAEFAIAWEGSTFHVPERTSFEEAATIPLAAMTAALGLHQRLELPLPWNPATKPIPLVVYGGSTAVGAFAIKLARLANIHPIIAVAGKGAPFVETLIAKDKGDVVLDYREGDAVLRQKVKQSTGGSPILHVYDAVSENESFENVLAALDRGGRFTRVLPLTGNDNVPEGIECRPTMVGSVHLPSPEGQVVGDQEFGTALFQFMGWGLAKGWFTGHPYEVRDGGLNGVEGLLKDLHAGKASAIKYVVRIGETPGVQS